MNKIPLVYEEFNAGEVMIQVNYDWDGMIEQIFLYSPFVNGLNLIDKDAFEQRYPSRYAYLQNRVNEALGIDYVRLGELA